MRSTLRHVSTAFAVSLLLVGGVASAAKPAAMKAARSTVRSTAQKKGQATKPKAEKVVTPAETQAAAVAAALEIAKGPPAAPATNLGIGYKIGRAIGSVTRAVFSPVKAFKAYRERSAAKRDFKGWLNRESHAEIRTYLKGARADSNVTANRVGYYSTAFSTAVSSGLTGLSMASALGPVAALNGAATAMHFTANRLFARNVQRGILAANTKTVDFALGNQSRFVAAARLDRWAKAGIIDAKYERTTATAETGATDATKKAE